MLFDAKITTAQMIALKRWTDTSVGMADILIASDCVDGPQPNDGKITVEQGDRRCTIDTDGTISEEER